MKSKLFSAVLIALFAIAFVFPLQVQAAAPAELPAASEPVVIQEADPVEEPNPVEELAVEFTGLAGCGGAIGLIVNILKACKVVKDGQARTWVAGLSMLGMAGLLYTKAFQPDLDIQGLDKQVADFVAVGVVIFGYIMQLVGAGLAHSKMAGVPVIGKSYSSDRMKMYELEAANFGEAVPTGETGE